MIQSLHISNYALIDQVDIRFQSGLNIITGETGAGKSIMLGALSLLLGERAEQRVIRDRDRKSIIEAVFTNLSQYPGLQSYCSENEIEWDDRELILRREIAPSGRSRAFINDSPVTLVQLRGLAIQLVDVHSQHQNLLLASPQYQLRIIDALAANGQLLEEYGKLYSIYRSAVARYRRFKRELAEAAADADFMRFQLDQISRLGLVSGEQAQLERERDLLANVGEVKCSIATILNMLSEGDDDTVNRLRVASEEASHLSSSIEDADQLADRLESLRIEVKDIADTFAGYDSAIESNPDRLSYIEERLNDIYALQRKHQVETDEQLIEIARKLEEKLSDIDNSDSRLEELEATARQAKSDALAVAEKISASREAEALKFARQLRDKALPLGMKNLAIDICLTRGEMTSTGIDSVLFMFAFNKNQELMPVGDTASGGEISRLMLVVKSIVAEKMQLPTIVFDEIDTGVSGDVALRMGGLMTEIAQRIQVIAITHLPQVAALGTSHFKVYKEDDDTSTLTHVRQLDENERIDELALMLSGSINDVTARAAAQSLLDRPTRQPSQESN